MADDDEYLDWQLTEDESATAEQLNLEHAARMMEVFGTRLRVVQANCIGSQLARMLVQATSHDGLDDALFLVSTVNDWLESTAQEYGGEGFRLVLNEQ